MSSLKNTFLTARVALKRNQGRTFLSVLGVLIGIMTVILVLSAGESIKALLINQVNSFGTDYVQVEVKVPSTSHVSTENAAGQAMGVQITTLTLADGEAIKKLDNVKDFYGAILSQDVISYRELNNNVFIFGASPSFINIDPVGLEKGRFYTEEEDKGLARVVVLGSTVAKNFFGDSEPVGKSIKINKVNYEVLGVLKSKGASMAFDMDKMVYVPVRTVQKLIMGVNYVSFLFNSVYDKSQSDFTAQQITDILRDRHDITDPNKDDFAVTTYEQGLSILGTITGAISILLILIGSISLIVGGVGIMNIMFVSVTERINEIGLRKALGATRSDISRQFLIEAVMITMIGGVLGVIFGILLTYLISVVAGRLGFPWPFVIKIQFILISVSVSVLVGLVAGYYPAKRAAMLHPIEALRSEV